MKLSAPIAHRCSLAIFIADEGIAGNSAMRIIFIRYHRRKKSRFASDFLRRGNRAHWGLKTSRDFPGAVKIAAATADNCAILVHSELKCKGVNVGYLFKKALHRMTSF